ncbi:MAG TPA: S1 RNA-binding domain-containing protein [Polyangiaceae bacterium]|nr:S1 RNA-binding domain-containing protein [Polyangiaceae bacterium]
MATDSFASLMTTEGGSDRARRRLNKGEVIDATVMQIAGEYVFIDVGMPSDGRIPRAELLDEKGKVRVSVGDRLRVSVVEPRFEGSLCKALGQAAPVGEETVTGNEVLAAKITRVEKFGVFVSTARGEGLIPLRELPLPPGSDHRKLFGVGKDLTVVLLDANAQGKLRFSATRVARVEEEQNFRDFAAGASDSAAAEPTEQSAIKAEATQKKKPPEKVGFGSLGDLMRGKLGLSESAKAATPSAQPRGDVLKRKR